MCQCKWRRSSTIDALKIKGATIITPTTITTLMNLWIRAWALSMASYSPDFLTRNLSRNETVCFIANPRKIKHTPRTATAMISTAVCFSMLFCFFVTSFNYTLSISFICVMSISFVWVVSDYNLSTSFPFFKIEGSGCFKKTDILFWSTNVMH